MSSNPSDEKGSLQQKSLVQAVVVDDKDPNESGRVKCRILGEQDDEANIPDDSLPWYQCMSGSSQVRGVGKFPAGDYAVGSKVILQAVGQQEFIVSGAVPNNLQQKETQDRDMESTTQSKRKKLDAPKEPSITKVFDGDWLGKLEGTRTALQMMNSQMQTPHKAKQNPKEDLHNSSGIPDYMGKRRPIKVKDGEYPTIGSFEHKKADLLNAQKYIQETLGSKAELIPRSLSILESLKKTASGSQNIPWDQSIGGMSNFQQAVQGISDIAQFEREGRQEKDERDLTLYEIYKLETGRDALDEDGNETEHYKQWLQDYIARGMPNVTAAQAESGLPTISVATSNTEPGDNHDHDDEYSLLGHGHDISDVTSLQSELDTKLDADSVLGGFKNKIINGDFRFWQRATSASNETSSGYHTADRWFAFISDSAQVDMSRQSFSLGQTDVPGNPKYFMRINLDTTGRVALDQLIEGVRTLSGKTATLSFYAKADANKSIAIDLIQNFGSGGSPSAFNSQLEGQVDLTTSWQKFTKTISIDSISGETLGSNGDDRLVIILRLAGDSAPDNTGTFDIAQVQLEEGDVATPFEQRPDTMELALCQRYYWSMHGNAFGALGHKYINASAGFLFNAGGGHPVRMRTSPTINVNWSSFTNCTEGSHYVDDTGFTLRVDATGEGVYRAFGGTVEFDAEL